MLTKRTESTYNDSSLSEEKRRTIDYEQKSFWSLCAYMVRSKKGIETLVNLINISYYAMKILSYKDETFSQYKNTSAQEFRLALSQQINQQVILSTLMENAETTIKSNAFIKALKSVLLSFGYHQ